MERGRVLTSHIEDFRHLMPIASHWAYLDHAAVSPLPQPTADAISAWLQQAANDGDTCWQQWSAAVENTRRLAAELINAQPQEIALVPNTTFGLNVVARGFPWQLGDNVVVPGNEFPSNLYAWMSLADIGVQTRQVPVEEGRLDIQRLIDACDKRTRLIAVSWVGYASGWRIDVAELCRAAHERNVLVMLDAIQGLGVFPLDVAETGVDFLAADGHKWLLGPEGAGIFYLRREHLPLLKSVQSGWNSVVGRHDFSHIEWKPREEAARFEGGTQNMVGCIGLGSSLEMLRSFGVSASASPVAEAILKLAAEARTMLSARGVEWISPSVSGHDSGILTFRVPGRDPHELRKRCLASGVALSVRGGGIRISLHGYNNRDDLERLCNVSFS
jgi:cysteine desulfurase / selenocysteine lyase